MVTLDTQAYEYTHGDKPRGYGYWLFAPMEPGPASSVIELTGTLTNCRKLLPAGTWSVCP